MDVGSQQFILCQREKINPQNSDTKLLHFEQEAF